VEERTDAELVALARKGDKEAFGELAGRHVSNVRRLAVRWVRDGDLAEDLTQEAVLQAYLSLDHLREPSRFRGWLFGILLNVWRGHLRDQRPLSLDAKAGDNQLDVSLSGMVVTVETIVEDLEMRRTVLDAANSLDGKYREAIIYFHYEHLSLAEISMIEGVSVAAVKVRLHRARLKLKALLESRSPEIVPIQRRKTMVQVTIADVIKQERTDDEGRSHTLYVVLLLDEAGRRALPIWIGASEGHSIAAGLGGLTTRRPLTFNFFAGLLQAINARVEEVRVETLQGDTYYGIVKIRSGRTVREIDARPSDALALAVRTGSPVFVAEDVMERTAKKLPEAGRSPGQSGVEGILKDMQQQLGIWSRPWSSEEARKAEQDLTKALSGE
jgi:RNA polymerase sigma factor (sigma-70 family)